MPEKRPTRPTRSSRPTRGHKLVVGRMGRKRRRTNLDHVDDDYLQGQGHDFFADERARREIVELREELRSDRHETHAYRDEQCGAMAAMLAATEERASPAPVESSRTSSVSVGSGSWVGERFLGVGAELEAQNRKTAHKQVISA